MRYKIFSQTYHFSSGTKITTAIGLDNALAVFAEESKNCEVVYMKKIDEKPEKRMADIMSKYTWLQCTTQDEEGNYLVEAWTTESDKSTVIAKIDLGNETVEYLDQDTKTDEDAQQVITEMLENGYVLTE